MPTGSADAPAEAPEAAGPIGNGSELPEAVELDDARAIRAIAHPARLVVIDALYDRGLALTATQAAALAGTSPSAMSYHLRALERYGLVRRGTPSGDGRERPWVRAAQDVRIRPPEPAAKHAVALATGAVVSTAIEVFRDRVLRSLQRGQDESSRIPLDSATSFQTATVIVTTEEARDLLHAIREVIDPMREERRTDPPEEAGRLSLVVATAPDTDQTHLGAIAEERDDPPEPERS